MGARERRRRNEAELTFRPLHPAVRLEASMWILDFQGAEWALVFAAGKCVDGETAGLLRLCEYAASSVRVGMGIWELS